MYIYIYIYTYMYIYIYTGICVDRYLYTEWGSLLGSSKGLAQNHPDLGHTAVGRIAPPGSPKKPTRVAVPSLRVSLGRRTVCGRTEQRRPPGSKRYKTKGIHCMGDFSY